MFLVFLSFPAWANPHMAALKVANGDVPEWQVDLMGDYTALEIPGYTTMESGSLFGRVRWDSRNSNESVSPWFDFRVDYGDTKKEWDLRGDMARITLAKFDSEPGSDARLRLAMAEAQFYQESRSDVQMFWNPSLIFTADSALDNVATRFVLQGGARVMFSEPELSAGPLFRGSLETGSSLVRFKGSCVVAPDSTGMYFRGEGLVSITVEGTFGFQIIVVREYAFDTEVAQTQVLFGMGFGNYYREMDPRED
jgi:hypothetical protein